MRMDKDCNPTGQATGAGICARSVADNPALADGVQRVVYPAVPTPDPARVASAEPGSPPPSRCGLCLMGMPGEGEGGSRCASPVRLMNMDFCPVTQRECVDVVVRGLQSGRGGWVITANLDHLRRGGEDGAYADAAAEADLVVADGMPLIWASRLQGTPLPERMAGSDLIWLLSAAMAAEGRSVFLLGGDPGTADGTAEVLRARYPGLRIAGTACPQPGFERDERAVAELTGLLVSVRPDLVFVALGCPKQEYLIRSLRSCLPQAWWMGVGISFGFVCGDVRRAPRWMQRLGLEWVHRLGQEPGRLARRYLLDGIPFAVMLLLRSAFGRSRGRGPSRLEDGARDG